MIQQIRNHAVYGICGRGKLHAGQFGTWLCAEVHADYFDLSYRCIWSVGAACRYGAGSCFDCDEPDNQRKKLYLSDCSV